MDESANEEMSLDDAQPTANGPPSPNSSILPALLQPLLSLIQPTPLSFPPPNASSPHPPTTSALSAIHTAALECLNNAFFSLATNPTPSVAADVDAGRRVWVELWHALEATGTEGGLGQEKRKEMWEIGVGVLWGVSIVWTAKIVRDRIFRAQVCQFIAVHSMNRFRTSSMSKRSCNFATRCLMKRSASRLLARLGALGNIQARSTPTEYDQSLLLRSF